MLTFREHCHSLYQGKKPDTIVGIIRMNLDTEIIRETHNFCKDTLYIVRIYVFEVLLLVFYLKNIVQKQSGFLANTKYS